MHSRRDAAEVMGSFQETSSRKTAEHIVKHSDGGVFSVAANHCDGGKSSMVVTTLHMMNREIIHAGKEGSTVSSINCVTMTVADTLISSINVVSHAV